MGDTTPTTDEQAGADAAAAEAAASEQAAAAKEQAKAEKAAAAEAKKQEAAEAKADAAAKKAADAIAKAAAKALAAEAAAEAERIAALNLKDPAVEQAELDAQAAIGNAPHPPPPPVVSIPPVLEVGQFVGFGATCVGGEDGMYGVDPDTGCITGPYDPSED